MGGNQPGEKRLAAAGEGYTHAPGVLGVAASENQSGTGGSVHEADGALVCDLQPLGELGDRRRPGEAAHEEHELVLIGRDPRGPGLRFREVKESPEGVPEPRQPPVVGLGGASLPGTAMPTYRSRLSVPSRQLYHQGVWS